MSIEEGDCRLRSMTRSLKVASEVKYLVLKENLKMDLTH